MECSSNQEVLSAMIQEIERIIKEMCKENEFETIILYSKQHNPDNLLPLLKKIRYELIVVSNRWVKRYNGYIDEINRINAEYTPA